MGTYYVALHDQFNRAMEPGRRAARPPAMREQSLPAGQPHRTPSRTSASPASICMHCTPSTPASGATPRPVHGGHPGVDDAANHARNSHAIGAVAAQVGCPPRTRGRRARRSTEASAIDNLRICMHCNGQGVRRWSTTSWCATKRAASATATASSRKGTGLRARSHRPGGAAGRGAVSCPQDEMALQQDIMRRARAWLCGATVPAGASGGKDEGEDRARARARARARRPARRAPGPAFPARDESGVGETPRATIYFSQLPIFSASREPTHPSPTWRGSSSTTSAGVSRCAARRIASTR